MDVLDSVVNSFAMSSKCCYSQFVSMEIEAMPNDQTNLVPPYVGFGVFKSTIDTLAQSVVPTGPLDRRVLNQLSGADYGALISALRFLGLADANKIATPGYRELIRSSTDPNAFKVELKRLLDSKYGPIIGSVNLQHGTISELERIFKDFGVTQGQMLTKTIRFLLKALGECGVELSPHITKPSPKTPRSNANKAGTDKNRTRTAKGTGTAQTPPEGNMETVPKGFDRLPIPGLPNAFIQYPVDLSEMQCTLLDGAVAFLRVYVTGKIRKETAT